MGVALEFRVLGPLELVTTDGEVPLTAGRQRALLATLLLQANRLVPVDRLVERLWDGRPPTQPHETVLTYVMRLRRALGADGDRIVTVPGGYRVDVGDEELDLHRFTDAVDEARGHESCGDLAQERALLRAALGLWRGEPLSNVPSDSLRREAVPTLVERRLRAFDRYAEVSIELGGHEDLVGELRAQVAEHPYQERLRLHLMRALHGSGRTAEALDCYADVRRRMADDLGLEPCAELQQLQRSILDDRPAAPRTVSRPRPRRPPVQLPPAPHLVGREDVLAELDGLLDPGRATLGVLTGGAGTGKTALALAWAHRCAGHFPDGLLFARLHGCGRQREPEPADAVLRRFLTALGVQRAELPDETDGLSARLCSELAGRRVLVVLDDAAAAEQVRPLLPPSPGAAVLVTSRRRLTGLAALDGARTIQLGPLPPAEAVRLLRHTTGRRDPRFTELAGLCGNLPLALTIAATRLASAAPLDRGPAAGDPLAELLDELREPDRLSALALTDPDTDLRAVYDAELARLEPGTAEVLLLLGCGDGLTDRQLADAAGGELAAVRRALAVLVEHNLVHRRGGRYATHELLAAHCRQHRRRVGTATAPRR